MAVPNTPICRMVKYFLRGTTRTALIKKGMAATNETVMRSNTTSIGEKAIKLFLIKM
jgi:hypothetical protein